jgi:hypothetical protein
MRRRSRRFALIATSSVLVAYVAGSSGVMWVNEVNETGWSECATVASEQGATGFRVSYRPWLPPDLARGKCHFSRNGQGVEVVLNLDGPHELRW